MQTYIDTLADCTDVVPPGPEHCSVNVVLLVMGSVSPLPAVVPEVDHGPPAVQLVALVDDHVSVARLPDATEAGETVRDAVGGGALHEPTPPLSVQP